MTFQISKLVARSGGTTSMGIGKWQVTVNLNKKKMSINRNKYKIMWLSSTMKIIIKLEKKKSINRNKKGDVNKDIINLLIKLKS